MFFSLDICTYVCVRACLCVCDSVCRCGFNIEGCMYVEPKAFSVIQVKFIHMGNLLWFLLFCGGQSREIVSFYRK